MCVYVLFCEMYVIITEAHDSVRTSISLDNISDFRSLLRSEVDVLFESSLSQLQQQQLVTIDSKQTIPDAFKVCVWVIDCMQLLLL